MQGELSRNSDFNPVFEDSTNFLFLEYSSLKTEQIERIKLRDGFTYLAILSVGALISFALRQEQRQSAALLAIPWVLLSLGWSFAVNDAKVARIAKYLQSRTSELGLVSWDGWRSSRRSPLLENRYAGFVIQNMVFVVPSIGASIFFLADQGIAAMRFGEWLMISIAIALSLSLVVAFWLSVKIRSASV